MFFSEALKDACWHPPLLEIVFAYDLSARGQNETRDLGFGID